jgi:hypothetical protein
MDSGEGRFGIAWWWLAAGRGDYDLAMGGEIRSGLVAMLMGKEVGLGRSGRD